MVFSRAILGSALEFLTVLRNARIAPHFRRQRPDCREGINSMNRTSGTLARTVISSLLAMGAILVSMSAALAEDRIRCAYPYWFGFAPVPVAIELGYFAEEGLEVETVFDNDRANVMPGLEIGDLDCTMRTIGEHMSRPLTADSDLVVIGVIDVSVGADGVVGAPGIESVTDLIGKTFAGEINHPGTLMTAHALKQAGHSFDEVNVRLIATDDGQAVFEDPEVAAVATWEPMLSEIVANTSRKGSKVLLSSADFNGLITDVVIVNKSDYEANREKYAKFMRGIYRAVDLYNNDEAAFSRRGGAQLRRDPRPDEGRSRAASTTPPTRMRWSSSESAASRRN